MNWKENGEGCFCLKYECLFCGQEFEYVCPSDYYTNEWQHHFGCCTHDCLEREFDYDKFKSKANELKNKIMSIPVLKKELWSCVFENLWKGWVEESAMQIWQKYETPEEIWNFHNEIAKSICIERELLSSGYDHEFAALMAWGDIDAVSQTGSIFKL